MAAPDNLKVTIEFPFQEHSRPVYLAGTFTQPNWAPQQMHPAKPGDVKKALIRDVLIQPGETYYYRFRVQGSNEWVLDDSKPTARDDEGVTSNAVCFNHAGQQVNLPRDDEANQARALDIPNHGQGSTVEEDRIRSPLFAHESFGGYEIVEDGFNHSPSQQRAPRLSPGLSSAQVLDLNDPTVEEFPSDRDSILGKLRKIQSSRSDDAFSLEDGAASPRHTFRRPSTDSADGSVASLELPSPQTSRRRERRLSSGSIGRNKSAVSLGAIAE